MVTNYKQRNEKGTMVEERSRKARREGPAERARAKRARAPRAWYGSEVLAPVVGNGLPPN